MNRNDDIGVANEHFATRLPLRSNLGRVVKADVAITASSSAVANRQHRVRAKTTTGYDHRQVPIDRHEDVLDGPGASDVALTSRILQSLDATRTHRSAHEIARV